MSKQTIIDNSCFSRYNSYTKENKTFPPTIFFKRRINNFFNKSTDKGVYMDIRIEKTERAIKNAFMELRAKKPLEKISIKELCELACINKSTFYAHYADIYALSETLEIETVNSIVSSISNDIEHISFNPEILCRVLCYAFMSHTSILNILFFPNEQGRLANRLETSIKEVIFKKHPEHRNDEEYNVLLSYCIHGAYYAYANNQHVPPERLIQIIENIVRTLQPLY